MRPIDADALFEHKVYAETPTISGDFIPGFAIDRAPTLDVMPVVRCGDCVHWRPDGTWGKGEVYACGKCLVLHYNTNKFFFCAFGHKREGE